MSTLDPLAAQAARILAEAMARTDDRDALWARFQRLVGEALALMDETPVKAALDDLERRGIDLDLLARLAQERSRARQRHRAP